MEEGSTTSPLQQPDVAADGLAAGDDVPVAQPAGTAAKRRQTLASLGRMPLEIKPLLAMLELKTDQTQRVIDVLRGSPMLASRVLALANCSAFKPRFPITTIERAVLQLGARRARTVALAHALRTLCRGCPAPEALINRLWVNCVAKACAARLMADHLGSSLGEVAFTQALMQDIGLYALLAIDPTFYDDTILGVVGRVDWCCAERQQFGIDHVDVGVHVLSSYRVDPSLIDSLRHHHTTPTSLEDPAAREHMPAFVASLLPHLHEDLQPTQANWLHGIFGAWLIERYDTPDQFVFHAYSMAAELGAGQSAAISRDRLIAALAEDVTGDVLQLVAENGRLDESRTNQSIEMAGLREEALSDGLTKLLNRRGFEKLAARRFAAAQSQGLPVAIAAIDLDGFKPINDTYGHDAGDQLLRGLAKLLRRRLDRHHLIARVGGDEFVIMMTGLPESEARAIATALDRAATGTLVRIDPHVQVPLRMSIGLAYAPAVRTDWTVDQLLEAADRLMYERKRTNKGGMMFGEFSGPAN